MKLFPLVEMDILEQIKERRSIRSYLNQPIEKEKLLKVLEAGRWAPSSGNIQNWRFVVVEEEETRIKLSRAAYSQDFIAEAPIIVVVCSLTDRIERRYDKRGRELYSIQNTSAAVENMMLEAHALGLATCWIGAFQEDRVKTILNIPEEVDVHALLPLGYPAEKTSSTRRDLNYLVYFNKYGNQWKKEKSKIF